MPSRSMSIERYGLSTSRAFPLPRQSRRADGLPVTGGTVELSGPFAQVVELAVRAERPTGSERLRDRFRRFWQEPVRLP